MEVCASVDIGKLWNRWVHLEWTVWKVQFVEKNCSSSSAHLKWALWKVQLIQKNCWNSSARLKWAVWKVQFVEKNYSSSSAHLEWTVWKVQFVEKNFWNSCLVHLSWVHELNLSTSSNESLLQCLCPTN